ncbi:MAG: MFS transporter [Spirochaetia bacterium]
MENALHTRKLKTINCLAYGGGSFFLIVIAPIAITFTLIWVPVNFASDFALFLYYFFAYILFYTTTTVALVPYSALSAEMTRNFKERNKLTGFRMHFSMIATLLSGLFAQPIIQAFGGNTTGHVKMGLCFGILFAVPWIFVFLGTWELPVEQTKKLNQNIFANFLSMFQNRSFRIHIAMYICAYGAMDILMAWFKFYFLDYLNRGGYVTIGLGSLLITQILVLPLYITIANKKGHAVAYRTGLSIWILAMIGMVFQRPDTPVWLLIANSVAIGAGLGAGTLIPFQILPFVADVDELMTGKKRAGIYSGAMTLLRKLIQGALVLPVLGILLSAIGYLWPLPAAFTQEQLYNDLIPRIEEQLPEERQEESIKLVMNAYGAEDGEGLNSLNGTSREEERQLRRLFDRIRYKGFGASNESVPIEQAGSTIGILRVLFFLTPFIFLFLGVVISLFFPINPKNHKMMLLEIQRLKEGGSPEDAGEEVREAAKKLSGKTYNRMPRFLN